MNTLASLRNTGNYIEDVKAILTINGADSNLPATHPLVPLESVLKSGRVRLENG